jgi:hypothetical protein
MDIKLNLQSILYFVLLSVIIIIILKKIYNKFSKSKRNVEKFNDDEDNEDENEDDNTPDLDQIATDLNNSSQIIQSNTTKFVDSVDKLSIITNKLNNLLNKNKEFFINEDGEDSEENIENYEDTQQNFKEKNNSNDSVSALRSDQIVSQKQKSDLPSTEEEKKTKPKTKPETKPETKEHFSVEKKNNVIQGFDSYLYDSYYQVI